MRILSILVTLFFFVFTSVKAQDIGSDVEKIIDIKDLIGSTDSIIDNMFVLHFRANMLAKGIYLSDSLGYERKAGSVLHFNSTMKLINDEYIVLVDQVLIIQPILDTFPKKYKELGQSCLTKSDNIFDLVSKLRRMHHRLGTEHRYPSQ